MAWYTTLQAVRLFLWRGQDSLWRQLHSLHGRILRGFNLLVKDSFVVCCDDLMYARHATLWLPPPSELTQSVITDLKNKPGTTYRSFASENEHLQDIQ